MAWTLGIETGGTFTDLFMVGPDGQVFADKVPSTRRRPNRRRPLPFNAAFRSPESARTR